jgi:hypothetical protein
MLPDGVTGTNEWDNPSGGTAAASNFDEDNDDTDYGRCINNEEISLTFADPSVDESAIGSITSVQIKTKSRYTNTVGVTSVNLKITMGTTNAGIGISNGTTTVAVAGSGTYQDINSDVEEYRIGTTAWSYASLEALKVKLEGSGIFARFKRLRTSYVYAEVIYEPAGYGNSVMGVASGDISEVNDVASSNISKVIGV